MFYHVVLMRFAQKADEAFFEAVEGYAERVRRECRGIEAYFLTANRSSRRDGLDHAVVGLFASSEAHDAYQDSQAHQEMKAFMAPLIERIVVLDTKGPA